MLYKQIVLKGKTPIEAETEIMFEVASGRADGIELLRFDATSSDDEREYTRLVRGIIRILRGMKEHSMIQFFAFPDNFRRSGTESKFLINKYPSLFEALPEEKEGCMYFYIKL